MAIVYRSLDAYQKEVDRQIGYVAIAPPTIPHPAFFFRHNGVVSPTPFVEAVYDAMEKHVHGVLAGQPHLIYAFGSHVFPGSKAIKNVPPLDIGVLSHIDLETAETVAEDLTTLIARQFPETRFRKDGAVHRLAEPVRAHVHVVKIPMHFYDFQTKNWRAFELDDADFTENYLWGVQGLRID